MRAKSGDIVTIIKSVSTFFREAHQVLHTQSVFNLNLNRREKIGTRLPSDEYEQIRLHVLRFCLNQEFQVVRVTKGKWAEWLKGVHYF